MIVAFSPEEEVEAFGEKLTLRLDFRAVTTIEGALEMQFPVAVAYARNSPPSYSVLSRMLWAMFREHHPEIGIDQCLGMVMDRGKEGAKVGFALDALLERAFPIAEDRKSKNPRKQNGRRKTSAVSGSARASTRKASGEKRRARS